MEFYHQKASESNELTAFDAFFGSTYIRHINGLYLAIENENVCLSRERFLWRVEAWENGRFYIRDESGHDHIEYYDGIVKSALDSGYTEQHWRLYHNNGGLVFLEHADSPNLFLHASQDNSLTISNEYSDEGCCFIFEDCSFTQGYPYIEYRSNANKIILRVEPTILYYAGNNWLNCWLDDLEKAYYSLSRLTGSQPFPSIEIRAYTNCNTWGYVFYGKPVIHINKDCFEKEIIRMRKRRLRDISFGTLHEMCHLFDNYAWLCEKEAMANIKLGYVLYELGFSASLSDRGEGETVTIQNYAKALYNEHGKLDNIKGLFCSALTGKMVEIAYTIGWDAYSYAFKNFPPIYNSTKLEKFEMLITKLSEHSRRDIRGMFSVSEWNSIVANLK